MNKILLTLLLGGFTLVACDDDTAMIGIDVMPGGDNVTSYSEQYTLKTSTVKVDSVLANTSTCYLGSIIDPDMRVKTTSSFMAQFHVPENFNLPKLDLMVKDDDGLVSADSCEIHIYFDKYYGDSLTTMKMNIQELDKNHVLEESNSYYTNIDPKKYVSSTTEYKKSITYSVKDLSRPDNETSGNRYYRQITVKLPTKYGKELLNKYYSNPEYFKNSYQFIHNVCPGFYFESAGGVGTMITTEMMAMDVYFRYQTKNAQQKDTIVDGMQRFGATEEVIQTTTIDNDYPGSLTPEQLDQKNCTYVKTPASLFTEMQIPVSEIVAGEHYTDSINQAKITIRKFNSESDSKYTLSPSMYLLMVRKAKINEFFEKNLLPNNTDSYLSTEFSLQTNAYQFANIAQLVTDLKIERDKGAEIKPEDTEAERNAKYAAWEANNPDWNKVMLVPVSVKFANSSDYYGQPVKTIQSVSHNLGLSSAKLEGGKNNPLKVEIIYSRYNR